MTTTEVTFYVISVDAWSGPCGRTVLPHSGWVPTDDSQEIEARWFSDEVAHRTRGTWAVVKKRLSRLGVEPVTTKGTEWWVGSTMARCL